MNINKIREAIGLLNCMVECGEQHSKRSRNTVMDALEELDLVSKSPFTLIAYKPDSELYSMGHTLERYPSEIVFHDNIDSIRLSEELATIIFRHKTKATPQESSFHVIIVKNQELLYDSESFQNEENKDVEEVFCIAKTKAIKLIEVEIQRKHEIHIESEKERKNKELEELQRLKEKYEKKGV